ncbi:MAG: bifunctional phosphopantothenoylcysteine decarboxylase/phosphopantothenate--cysteine ligase CoaBC [Cyanobacteria bacterium NC_groundwater_1444_Ag_S-0.65um_54_12]|nr:bifunctional phosphopantothenoylcysteine decarboxylase/phosphopantothenate--cysteine ligase CoaBC [Cyanobacteria bacterium NC_groundwater_1444_Ag_S-0.65um_54_12]
MPRLLLGVCGGIAAYKAIELAVSLHQADWSIQTILTQHAAQFVTPLTFEAITQQVTHTDSLIAASAMRHISLARNADIVAIVPATANCLAKLASGLADDLLSTVLLATTAPVVIAPAMNTTMWYHPATQANLALLRQRGVNIVEPANGKLACGEVGTGRLADLSDIVSAITALTKQSRQLAGYHILVTAGGTREPIDPVRYIGNRSSGQLGFHLANEALRRGARVTLISAAGNLPAAGMEVIYVATANEMYEAVMAKFDQVAALVMNAAVADWRPAYPSGQKLKKADMPNVIEIAPTIDILAEVGRRRRSDQLLVGFAAESENLLVNAAKKLRAKRVDLLVANDACSAMEAEASAATVLAEHGIVAELTIQPKASLAAALWDIFLPYLSPVLAP